LIKNSHPNYRRLSIRFVLVRTFGHDPRLSILLESNRRQKIDGLIGE